MTIPSKVIMVLYTLLQLIVVGPRPLFGRVLLCHFRFFFLTFSCARCLRLLSYAKYVVLGWDVNVHLDVLTCHLPRYWSLLVFAQLRHVCCLGVGWVEC